MSLKQKLLSNQPKLTQITINHEPYYLKALTVGDMNRLIFEQRQWLIAQAAAEGVELPAEDSDDFEQVLERFGNKYSLARTIASRLCDEDGNRLFDPNNIEDLNAISGLDSQVFVDFSKAVEVPKD